MSDPSALDQAWKALDPLAPIPPDDPRGWYVDLSAARGPVSMVQQVVRNVLRQPDRPTRSLLLGHSGSGKSTELLRLRRHFEENGYRCALLAVDQDLDREDLDLVELQVLIVERVGAVLLDVGLDLSADRLHALQEWFAEEERETVREAGRTVEADSGGPGLMKAVFGGLLPGVKAGVRVDERRRKVLREKVRRRLRDFVDLVTELVAEANGLLQQSDFKGLVLLVDGIEKAALSADGLQRVTRILFDQVEQWARLPVPQVITAPLQVLAESTRIQHYYHKHYLLSSVPVAARPDHPGAEAPYVEAGRALLTKVIERRFTIDAIFADTRGFEQLLDRSGGSIRDLFALVREAIDAADGGKVGQAAVDLAVRAQQLQMELALQPDDVEPLRKLLSSPETLYYDAVGIRLLQKELALHYVNGGSWFGVHPAVRERIGS